MLQKKSHDNFSNAAILTPTIEEVTGVGHLLTIEEAGATITRVEILLAIAIHSITTTVTHLIEVTNQLYRRRRIHPTRTRPNKA